MMPSSHLVKFVTIDGPSAIGKTTVARHLAMVLRQRSRTPLVTTTPSLSAIGTLARSGTHCISGHALSCLVAADRYDHYQNVVLPAIKQDRTVVCNRFVPSALVLDWLDGVPYSYVEALYYALPRPHVAFVLMGDPAVCVSRAVSRYAQYSRFHSYDLEVHERERDLFGEAISVPRRWSYPVAPVDIDNHDPARMASRLADIVCSDHEEIR